MTTPRLGPQQAAIARALRAGEQLTLESGIWRLGPVDEPSRSVSGASCRRMVARGILVRDRVEDHPAYLGGRCEWYVLSDAGIRAIEEQAR
jgi:hypothetical protein